MSLLDTIKGMFGFQSKDDNMNDVVEKWVAERFHELKGAFTTYHLKIWEAILFYAGETWITLDESSKTYRIETPQDDWVPTPRINRFSPTIDSISSNFTVPEIEAVSVKSGDPSGQSVANICTKLAQYAIRQYALRSDYKSDEDKMGMAEKSFVLAGCVLPEIVCKKVKIGERPVMEMKDGVGAQCLSCDKFFKGASKEEISATGSCPSCGSELQYSSIPISSPVVGEDGNPVVEPIYDYTFKVKVGIPLYALPRVGATSMANSPYLMWAERMTVDEVWELWGDKFPEGEEPHPDSVHLDGFSSSYQNSLNYFYAGYSSSSAQEKDSLMVVRVFIQPGKMKQFPEGMFAVYLNDHLLFWEPWDFPDHPITKIDYLQIPTLFFPRSISFDLVPVQRELQSYESIIKLHAMTSAVDPIIIDENTTVTQPTGRADKIIKWRSIGPGSREPHRMAHGTLDDGVYRQRDSLHAEFENISGSVAVWKGRQEGAITAASAIQQLRSQAELMFSKPTINWNNGWKEVVRKLVKFMQAKWPVEKFVEILGEELVSDIQLFMKSNLDTCVEFVATTHGLPRTRDDQRQEMVALFDKGVLDINDVNVRRKAFELFGDTGMLKSFNLDAVRARLENEAIKNGGSPTFRPGIEDSLVHSQIHKEQVKSLDFDRWPPQAQEALIRHIAETDMYIASMVNQNAPARGEKEEDGELELPGPIEDGRAPVPIERAEEAPRTGG